MLDHIAILDCPSLGRLAELLLFYSKVTLFVHERVLRDLCKRLGPDVLVDLLEDQRESLELRFITWGIWSSHFDYESHWVQFEIGDEDSIGVDEPFLDYLDRTACLDSPEGYLTDRVMTDRLLSLIKRDHTDSSVFRTLFEDDLVNTTIPEFCRAYIKRFQPIGLHEFPKGLDFRYQFNDFGNPKITFSAKKQLKPDQCNCVRDMLTAYVYNVGELPIWSNLSSELFAEEKTAFVIRDKVTQLLARRDGSAEGIERFTETVLQGTKAVSEAIDHGGRTFAEFIRLYRKSRRFRKWLNGLPFDANLVSEYVREVTADNWAEKLPTKVARWGLFTGIGAGIDALGAGGLGTLGGLTVSAIDALLLDNLIKGWKPNHFVERDLKRFIGSPRQ